MAKQTLYISQEGDGYLTAHQSKKDLKDFYVGFDPEELKGLKLYKYVKEETIPTKSVFPEVG
jgi:hypothetical protein